MFRPAAQPDHPALCVCCLTQHSTTVVKHQLHMSTPRAPPAPTPPRTTQERENARPSHNREASDARRTPSSLSGGGMAGIQRQGLFCGPSTHPFQSGGDACRTLWRAAELACRAGCTSSTNATQRMQFAGCRCWQPRHASQAAAHTCCLTCRLRTSLAESVSQNPELRREYEIEILKVCFAALCQQHSVAAPTYKQREPGFMSTPNTDSWPCCRDSTCQLA